MTMDSEPEFSVPNRRESESVQLYFQIEQDFMAARHFYETSSNLHYRRQGIAVIARVWGRRTDDAYIPYLALNYFDRFVTRNALPEWPNCTVNEQVCLVAICCVTLSYKMRTKRFSLGPFLSQHQLSYKLDEITTEEFRILEALDWRMRSITPFYFLDYYYPNFKQFGGFKRRCINKIIVQCLGVDYFSEFKPSQIARAALLAATYVAYPSKMNSIEQPEELSNCWRELVNLCHKLQIDIHTESGTVFHARDIAPLSQTQSKAVETRSTRSEEELAEAVASRVQKHTYGDTDFRNTVLGKDNDAAADSVGKPQGQDRGKAVKVADTSEEEDDVAPLTSRQRHGRGWEVVEASAKVAAAETEAKQQGHDPGKAVNVADTAEEEEDDVAPLTRRQRYGRGREVVEASAKVAAAETEAKQQGHDPGKAVNVADTSEEEEDDVAPLTRRQRHGRSLEVVEASAKVAAADETEAKQQGHDPGKAVNVADTSEEEEDDVAPLTRRQRHGRGWEVVEASAKVAAVETEAKQHGHDPGKAVKVADISEEKDIEAETGGKEDKVKGGVKASDEIVAAETEVNPRGQDKGKGKAEQEIVEDVQAEIEYNRIRRARGKAKVGEEKEDEAGKARFMWEIIPAAEEAPKKQMNFKLKWPILVEHGETIDKSQLITESVQCPQTIRGTGQDPPLYTHWYSNCTTCYNNCCIII